MHNTCGNNHDVDDSCRRCCCCFRSSCWLWRPSSSAPPPVAVVGGRLRLPSSLLAFPNPIKMTPFRVIKWQASVPLSSLLFPFSSIFVSLFSSRSLFLLFCSRSLLKKSTPSLKTRKGPIYEKAPNKLQWSRRKAVQRRNTHTKLNGSSQTHCRKEREEFGEDHTQTTENTTQVCEGPPDTLKTIVSSFSSIFFSFCSCFAPLLCSFHFH